MAADYYLHYRSLDPDLYSTTLSICHWLRYSHLFSIMAIISDQYRGRRVHQSNLMRVLAALKCHVGKQMDTQKKSTPKTQLHSINALILAVQRSRSGCSDSRSIFLKFVLASNCFHTCCKQCTTPRFPLNAASRPFVNASNLASSVQPNSKNPLSMQECRDFVPCDCKQTV